MKITDTIASNVGNPLGQAEQALTLAVKEGASMMAAVAQGILDAQIPVAIASDLISDGLVGLTQLGAAGRAYATLHGQLSALARKAGLDPAAYGQSLPGTPPSLAALIDLEEHRRAA